MPSLFDRDRHRSANERELDNQNKIVRAAQTLLGLGGTKAQTEIARRALRMAEGRLNAARVRVQQDRANERSR